MGRNSQERATLKRIRKAEAKRELEKEFGLKRGELNPKPLRDYGRFIFATKKEMKTFHGAMASKK